MVKIAKRAELATPRISSTQNNWRPRPSAQERGLTLLEVIITVSIIAGIVAMAMPHINKRNTEIRSVVRKFAVLSRQLKSQAKLYNSTYRLVMDLGDGGPKPKHTFWVEKAQGQVLNNYDPKNPPKLAKPEDKPDENAAPSPFAPDTRIMRKPEELPDDMLFESVELGSLESPITSGVVYIHYFPTGFADEAAIHIKVGDKLKWTLAVAPLSGKMEIIDKFVELDDLRPK